MLSKLTAGSAIASSFIQGISARDNTLESLQSTHPSVQAMGTGWDLKCTAAVDRLKRGPDDWTEVIGSGRTYKDDSFSRKDQYFKLPWAGWGELRDYWLYSYTFERLPDVFPDATLFGTDNIPKWSDVEQGYSGTCYILAAMAALTEFPDIAKSVFLTDTLNDEGIYAIKFFIRGKPWIVTVDDSIMMWNNVPNFASIGPDKTFWAPILQKAFAKVKGSYGDANGGFVTTGFRSLVGSPVFDYLSFDETDNQEVFDRMKAANDLDYLLGAGTFGSDTSTNSCGIVAGHAYSVISAFELTSSSGSVVDHQLYMIRNPWGETMFKNGIWSDGSCSDDDDDGGIADSYGDTCADWYDSYPGDCGAYDTTEFVANTACCGCGGGTWGADPDSVWTDDYRSQVPHSVDSLTAQNDGIFFMDRTEFLGCFDDFQIGHYRDGEGYTDDWIDVEDQSTFATEEFTISVADKLGDLYFTVETYYYGMIPYACSWFYVPFADWTVYKNGVVVASHAYSEVQSQPILVVEDDYAAGDVFTVNVNYSWYGWTAEDFTVKVYSKQDLQVTDTKGKTNQLHMDGTSPSGFTGFEPYSTAN